MVRTNSDSESNRLIVRKYYASRDQANQYEMQWGYVNPVAGAYWRLRDELAFKVILAKFDPLSRPVRVLEIGSGHGHELAKFGLLGILPAALFGVDLIGDRVRRAKESYPHIAFSEQDATHLEFPEASFDIVFQYTCVMHADCRETQAKICSEMIRILKPGGMILWWDIAPVQWRVILAQRIMDMLIRPFAWRKNAALVRRSLYETFSGTARRSTLESARSDYIRPISADELTFLFPRMIVKASSAGLDFDIWAPILRHWRGLAEALWRWSLLPGHCFAVIEKPADAPLKAVGKSSTDTGD